MLSKSTLNNHITLTNLCLLGLTTIFSNTCYAEAGTLLGKGSAEQCFEESQLVFSTRGLAYCDNAIQKESLRKYDLAATYSNRGIIYGGNGRYQLAIRDHTKAIELIPTLGQAYVNRGNAYYHSLDYELALSDYDQALLVGGSQLRLTHINRCIVLLKLHRIDEALIAAQKAVELAPNSKRANKLLADVKDVYARRSER